MTSVNILVLGASKESNSQFCLSVVQGHGTKVQDFSVTKKKDGHSYHLHFMNIDTQIDRASAYNQANIYLILYNVDAGASFASIEQQWLPEICEQGGPAPIVIVATNIDKRSKTNSEHITTKQGEGLVAHLKLAAYCECNSRIHSSVAKAVDAVFHVILEDVKAKKDPKHPFYHSLLPWGKKPKAAPLRHSSSNPIPASYAKSSLSAPNPPPKSITPPPMDLQPIRKSSVASPPNSRPSSPSPTPPSASPLQADIELSYPPTTATYQPPPPPIPPPAPAERMPVKKQNISTSSSPAERMPVKNQAINTTSPPAERMPVKNQPINSPPAERMPVKSPNINTTTSPAERIPVKNQNMIVTQPSKSEPLLQPASNTTQFNINSPPTAKNTQNAPMSKKYGSVEWDISAKELVFLNLQGKGAYGEVWKGKWIGRGGGLIVAIKKVPIMGLTDRMREEIFTEVSIMVKLRYQSIVTIYGKALTEQELCIVLEYVEGGDLASFLSSKVEIGWDIKIKLALQATRSVHYLHSLNPPVLHRDLKSPNFLVCTPSMDLKLTDFGMSKVKSIASNVNETASTAAAGSYRWSAPETIAKYPKWTEKADIFSLGMVFYEIVARKIPFEEISDSHHILFLVKSERERPDIPSECPKQFAEIIEQCWEHDPDLRPNSSELLEMLQKLLESPIEAFIPAKSRNLFFKVNEELLLHSVSPDSIRMLTQPPPFPSRTLKPPEIPTKVTLVRVTRTETNPLLSKTYDAEIFERVEVYFRRFFAPKDSTLKVTLDEVDVILNDAVERRFTRAEADLHASCAGMAEMKDEDQSDLQQLYLNHLLTSQNLVPQRNSNPISAWHGANSNTLESICWYGMLNLSTTDPGYYGKAMYFTQRPKYGEYYAQACEARNEGKFQLLLCWVLLGKPYAITKVALHRACEKGYTSHYTLVTKKQATREICATKSDFDTIDGLQSFFPVKSGDEIQGDEVAIFDSCHILPRFIVHYSVTMDPQQKFRGVSFYNSM